jgi:hypothetical protein
VIRTGFVFLLFHSVNKHFSMKSLQKNAPSRERVLARGARGEKREGHPEMRIFNPAAIAAVALTGGLAIGVAVGQATADQPHMQNALDALQRARSELQAAAADKGGHRVKAMGYVDSAIAETRAGIRFAR